MTRFGLGCRCGTRERKEHVGGEEVFVCGGTKRLETNCRTTSRCYYCEVLHTYPLKTHSRFAARLLVAPPRNDATSYAIGKVYNIEIVVNGYSLRRQPALEAIWEYEPPQSSFIPPIPVRQTLTYHARLILCKHPAPFAACLALHCLVMLSCYSIRCRTRHALVASPKIPQAVVRRRS